MIRYRRLYESENSDIKLYDVVSCADWEWYVIDIDGDIVTLLAKDADFGEHNFDNESNSYESSKIREYLKKEILPYLDIANPIPTRLDDVEVTDKVWLLSVKEAEKLPLKIREFDDDWYWLRSPGDYSYIAATVYDDGSVDSYGGHVNNDSGGVRPAMRVHIEDLD